MRKLFRETKYLEFYIIDRKPKTIVVHVVNKHKHHLGTIQWHSPWRQYTWNISTQEGTVLSFNNDCLLHIAGVVSELNTIHKEGTYETLFEKE